MTQHCADRYAAEDTRAGGLAWARTSVANGEGSLAWPGAASACKQMGREAGWARVSSGGSHPPRFRLERLAPRALLPARLGIPRDQLLPAQQRPEFTSDASPSDSQPALLRRPGESGS